VNCPVDNEVLQMSERQGVEVDYCPRCRGVWLDRGELDKILERASVELDDDDYRDRDRHGDRDDYRDRDRERYSPGYGYGDRGSYPHKTRKRSFLSDMFEFGGDD
jgi:Zn-finger nucleic acid-binding protein